MLKHNTQRILITVRRDAVSELKSSMNQLQVGQKTYEMPPQEGITIAHFIVVADIERSARFYERSSAPAS